MKKIILTGLILLFAIATFDFFHKSASASLIAGTEEIKWYTLEEAQKLSDAAPRKIFIDFTTSWCGWCKVMDANTFQNPTIAKYMNEKYYCVKFNAETQDSVVFNGQKFGNRGAANARSANDFTLTVLQGKASYPSFAFISKDRMSFTIMQGYMPPEQFEPYIHYYGEDMEKTTEYAEFIKTFKTELPSSTDKQSPPAATDKH